MCFVTASSVTATTTKSVQALPLWKIVITASRQPAKSLVDQAQSAVMASDAHETSDWLGDDDWVRSHFMTQAPHIHLLTAAGRTPHDDFGAC